MGLRVERSDVLAGLLVLDELDQGKEANAAHLGATVDQGTSPSIKAEQNNRSSREGYISDRRVLVLDLEELLVEDLAHGAHILDHLVIEVGLNGRHCSRASHRVRVVSAHQE